MHHREPSHLEEWAALLGDDIADDAEDVVDGDRRSVEDARDRERLYAEDEPT